MATWFFMRSRNISKRPPFFSLAISLFNFKFFAEAMNKILQSYLTTSLWLQEEYSTYELFINCLNIPRQNTKDVEYIVVPVLKLEVIINNFIICIPSNNLARA